MTFQEVENIAQRFLRINSLDKLVDFLETPLYAFEFILENKAYKEFYVRKQNGGRRKIEDPEKVLKEILRNLNEGLQAVYYIHRSNASFGFQIVTKNEPNPRNIKSNAESHIKKPWMINADFKDFFHQIHSERLVEIFRKYPFDFNESLATVLTNLCTFKGRLPMGSPTSPVLSDFSVLSLDADYEDFSKAHHLTYTRFVDDLTFSSLNEITDEVVSGILQIAKVHSLVFNPSKIHIYKPEDSKIVTGLTISSTIGLPNGYFEELEKEIGKFANTWEINARAGKKDNAYLKKIRQQIEGRIQFGEFVLGLENNKMQELKNKYLNATTVDYYDSVSWSDWGYQSFLPNRRK